MTEKPLTFEGLVATAKTLRERQDETEKLHHKLVKLSTIDFVPMPLYNELNKKLDEELVSLGLVLQREKLLRERILSLYRTADHLSHEDERNSIAYILKDFFEAQTEEGVFGGLFLKEVFGVGSGEKKEGDSK